MSGRGLRIAGLCVTAALCALLSARGSLELQAQARFLPSHAMRAHDTVDGIGEPEAPPVFPDLIVATRERVRDENHAQAMRSAPTDRGERAGDGRRHKIERHGHRDAQALEIDVVCAQRGVVEPLLVPAQRFLAQRALPSFVFREVRRDHLPVGAGAAPEACPDELIVPVTFTELAPQRLACELVQLVFGCPVLDERVADIEERRLQHHVAIVSSE